MSSAEYFCDISLTPFCNPFHCKQHRMDLWISCSTGTFGWRNTVGSSTSCFLSSFRRSPISSYLQGFIIAIPKFWHCSSTSDLHITDSFTMSYCITYKQKVQHCLTLLHRFTDNRNQCIAYMYWEKDNAKGDPAPRIQKLSVWLGTITGKLLLVPELNQKGAFRAFDFAGSISSRLLPCFSSLSGVLHILGFLSKPSFHPHQLSLLRIREWLRLEVISGGHLVQAELPRVGCPGLHSYGFWLSSKCLQYLLYNHHSGIYLNEYFSPLITSMAFCWTLSNTPISHWAIWELQNWILFSKSVPTSAE